MVNSIEFKKALQITLDSIEATDKTETIDINEALNRVLSSNIYSKKSLPPYNNAAMDGYAFRHKDINNKLKVVATIFAGDTQEPILKDNECYKIMTGAKIPSDCDTVVQHELCKEINNEIEILNQVKKANAFRVEGEELKEGNLLLEKGEALTPPKIALLASQGITKIECFKELKIAIISTGNELKEPYEKASKDELYNINGINIQMHLKSFGIKSQYIGVVPDDLESATKYFNELKSYDIIISSGGVSLGEADYTKKALLENSFKELFHGVKVKPGHPLLVGYMDKTLVIALPGNPLAAIMHLILFAQPVILKKQGAINCFLASYGAVIGKELTLKPNRVNIVLGSIKNNKFYPYKDNKYGSGMILPLVESNAVALFDENISYIEDNSEIKVIYLQNMERVKNIEYI